MGKILQFPKKNKKRMTKWTPPELPIDPKGYEVKEFTFDLNGVKGMIEDPNFNTDDFFKVMPNEVLEKIFLDVREEFKKDDKVSDVHDACFEVQLLAEQYPEHASYIETKVQQLTKQLIVYISNKKEK
jgi:hypothetical protein